MLVKVPLRVLLAGPLGVLLARPLKVFLARPLGVLTTEILFLSLLYILRDPNLLVSYRTILEFYYVGILEEALIYLLLGILIYNA